MEPSLFNPPSLDDRVSDCILDCPVRLTDLTDTFGTDLTWRQVIHLESNEVCTIPGWGPKTERALRNFISNNIQYSFEDFLKDS